MTPDEEKNEEMLRKIIANRRKVNVVNYLAHPIIRAFKATTHGCRIVATI